MNRTIWDFLSLYELIPAGMLLVAAMTQNVFLATFAVAVWSKQLPEKTMKRLIPFPDSLRARPSTAFDCNWLNKGGEYASRAGFPSGHTTTVWFIFSFLVIQAFRDKDRRYPITCAITGVLAILVPYARVALECHTPIQIYGGMLTGLVWAVLFDQIEQRILLTNATYRAHRDRVFQHLR